MIRASKLYGMNIFDNNGRQLGKVHDLILNLETGSIVRITTASLTVSMKEDIEDIIKRRSILYKNVLSAKDIMIVKSRGVEVSDEITIEAEKKLLGKK